MQMQRGTFSILFIFIIGSLFSQEREDRDTSRSEMVRFYDVAPGMTYFYMRDEGMSPLIYQGFNFTANSRIQWRNNKMRHGINYHFVYGNLKTQRHPTNPSQVENLRMELDHYYVRHTYEDESTGINVFLGGSVNVLGTMRSHQRFGNNALNYDGVFSLNVNALAEYDFQLWSRDFELSYRVFIPVYGYVFRPSYATSVPGGFINQQGSDFRAALESGHHATVNQFFRWNNTLELNYSLKNGNRLRLSYVWDYYSIAKTHPVKVAMHQVLIGTMFNF